MGRHFARMLHATVMMLLCTMAWAAGPYADTINLFKNAGESASFFAHSYGYAVFPTVSEGALLIGGGHGRGELFEHGRYVGDLSLARFSIGPQLGGQAYSEIVFFEDEDTFDRFILGNFQFGADASAVAVTAAASARDGTAGPGISASGGEDDAKTAGAYHNGIAVFTIAKGGAMIQASVGGQKFSFKPSTVGDTDTASASPE